jgi:hypothetical protein
MNFIIIFIIFFISFMQGIYSYITETNHVPRVYKAAAVLWSLLMLLFMLFPLINVLCFYINNYFPKYVLVHSIAVCSS